MPEVKKEKPKTRFKYGLFGQPPGASGRGGEPVTYPREPKLVLPKGKKVKLLYLKNHPKLRTGNDQIDFSCKTLFTPP